MIDGFRQNFEGQPLERASETEFKRGLANIQKEVIKPGFQNDADGERHLASINLITNFKQSAQWKVFVCVIHHPLDFTILVKKYIGGSIQSNQLESVGSRLNFE